MNALVGYTGFVGGNLYASGAFDCAYNSQNISDAFGTAPDLLVYAGLRAEKYLANHEPEKDLAQIRIAEENIERIRPNRLVLISTIDVFRNPRIVDETSVVDTTGLAAYGLHRYSFEQWARGRYPDALIVRLPGLYGRGIKKNFIYDFIHRIPTMLTEDKITSLGTSSPSLKEYYSDQGNGFWHVRPLSENGQEALRGILHEVGFSALQFTDSRSRYQFYDLGRLWTDLQTALREDLRLWHPATEPVSAAEVYEYLTGEAFVNELDGTPADYDYRTVYAEVFGGKDGYLCGREEVLRDIKMFVDREMKYRH